MSVATNKTADKLEALADRLQQDIDNGRRPMSQNPTPKRLREYRSRLHDADNWERCQRALRALAEAHRAGSCPLMLSDLTTKAAIYPLVRKGLLGGGYYEVLPDPEYADKTPGGRTLQAMIEPKHAADIAADRDRRAKQAIDKIIDDIRFSPIDGFFPTPAPVVETMLLRADIRPGHTVLEPSAGIGSIADAIREQSARMNGAGVQILCCEIVPRLREILAGKGYDLTTEHDCMDIDGDSAFDRIVMNPPFERMQDAAHVRHAYDLLAPGGRLVALMSPSAFIQDRRQAQEFRDWLISVHGRYEVLPEGCFKGVQAFRQTGIRVMLVVIDKR